MESKLKTSDFSYSLPEELVAQNPCDQRENSRLLIYDNSQISESVTKDLSNYIDEGTLFVRNNSRVIPSRLLGETIHGGKVELMLIEPISDTNECQWKALGKPLKKMKVGSKLIFSGVEAEITNKNTTDDTPFVVVSFSKTWDEFYSWLEQTGYIPLPPYIKRNDPKPAHQSEDTARYQTVYAAPKGSVAAPTAGLHFTNNLIDELISNKNVDFADVTLHVGAGTFLPVKSDDIFNHKMHHERYFISSESYYKIAKARSEGRKVICIGTTSLRCLESFYLSGLKDSNWEEKLDRWSSTNLFIYPKDKDYKYKPGLIDGIMTNFHQSESTLLMLISSLLGVDETRRVYQYAKDNKFRFFSYGDSSLLKL